MTRELQLCEKTETRNEPPSVLLDSDDVISDARTTIRYGWFAGLRSAKKKEGKKEKKRESVFLFGNKTNTDQPDTTSETLPCWHML